MKNRVYFVEQRDPKQCFFKETITFARNRNLENSFHNFSLKWTVYIDKSIKIDPDLKEADNDKLQWLLQFFWKTKMHLTTWNPST